MWKIQTLKTLLLVFFFQNSFSQQSKSCQIENSILMVPKEGCSLQSQLRDILVKKISLNGELIIEQEIAIKYESLEIGENAQFNFNSKDFKISLEDISQNECKDLENQKQIKIVLSSYYKTEFYDIGSIENGDQLTIINRRPFFLSQGSEVLLISDGIQPEYSFIESIESKKIKLKSKLQYTHSAQQVISFYGDVSRMFPQAMCLNRNTIHFKKTCLNLFAESDINGVFFEDVKGLIVKDNNNNKNIFKDIMILDSQTVQTQNNMSIQFSYINSLTIVNVKRNIKLQTKNLIQDLNIINSQLIELQVFEGIQSKIFSSIIKIISLTEDYLRINDSYIINSQLTFQINQDYSTISISQSNLINTDIVCFIVNEIFLRELSLHRSFFKNSQFDFSKTRLLLANFHQSTIEGQNKDFFMKFTSTDDEHGNVRIYLQQIRFNNFLDSNKPLLVADQEFKGKDRFEGYNDKFKAYNDKFDIMIENVSSYPLNTGKLIANSNARFYTFTAKKYDQYFTPFQSQIFQNLYSKFAYYKYINSFVSQDILVAHPTQLIYFDMQENNQNYNIEVSTSIGKASYNFNKVYPIIFDHLHKFKISLKPGITNSPKKITLSIQQYKYMTQNYIMPLIIEFDSNYPIKSLIINKIIQNNQNNIFQINYDYKIKQHEIVIEFCELNQLFENGECKDKCSYQDSIIINGVCQNLKVNPNTQIKEYDQINFYKIVQIDGKSSYQQCPFNCKTCKTKQCDECTIKNIKGRCEDNMLGYFLNLEKGINMKCALKDCEICSFDINQCFQCSEKKILVSTREQDRKKQKAICEDMEQEIRYEIDKDKELGFLNEVSVNENCLFRQRPDDNCINCEEGYRNEYGFCKKQIQEKTNKEIEFLNKRGYADQIDEKNFQCLEGYYKDYSNCKKSEDNLQKCDGNICYNPKICIKGMFYSQEKLQCIYCNKSCLECENENKCISCPQGIDLYNNKCECPIGHYFELSSNLCQKCQQNNCFSCNSNQCLSCQIDYNLYQNACIKCELGEYFDQGSGKCLKCNDNCKECEKSSTQCTSCKDNKFTLIGNKCIICSPLCQKCVDENICIQCKEDTFLQQNTCVQCPPGQYSQSGENNCKNCKEGCQRCSGSENNCLSCNAGFYQNSNTCLKCESDEYSLNGMDRCEKCDFSCKECSGSSKNCILCKDDTYHFKENLCIKCNLIQPQCEECNNDSTCNLCFENAFMQSGKCVECPQGQFSLKGENTCKSCQEGCFKCQGLSDNCLSCQSGYFLQQNKCIKCKSGEFSDDGANECQKCDISCLECTKSSTNCVSCKQNTYYLKDNKCQKCSLLQPFCEECSDDKTCDLCSENSIMHSKKCIECPPGQFSLKGETSCKNCSEGCSKCQGLSDNCLSCQSGYFLQQNKCIKCKSGEFSDDGANECQKCDISCLECSKSSINCVSCKQNTYYLKDNKCQKCSLLQPFCEECSDDKTCDLCSENSIMHSKKCIECPPGQFSLKGETSCKNCSEGCSKCQGSQDKCLKCQSGYFLSQNKCVKCKSGEFSNEGDNKCSKCDDSCLECDSKDICNSCKDKTYYLKDQKCIKCNLLQPLCEQCSNVGTCDICFENSIIQSNNCVECPSGQYSLKGESACKQCTENCLKCQGTSENCLKCESGYYLEQNKCVKCQSGEFSKDGDNKCSKCDESCLECSSFSNCLKCKSKEYNLVDSKCILIDNNESNDSSELTAGQIIGIVLGVFFIASLITGITVKIILYKKKVKMLSSQKYQIRSDIIHSEKELIQSEGDLETMKNLETKN